MKFDVGDGNSSPGHPEFRPGGSPGGSGGPDVVTYIVFSSHKGLSRTSPRPPRQVQDLQEHLQDVQEQLQDHI